MSSSMAFFSSTTPHLSSFSSSSPKTNLPNTPFLTLRPQRHLLSVSFKATENGSGAAAIVVEEEKPAEPKEGSLGNGAPVADDVAESAVKFEDPKWVSGTWDLKQFQKDGTTDWDAVIDAGEILVFFTVWDLELEFS